MNTFFDVIVGCANIIACIASVISLIKVSQINQKLSHDSNKIKTENNGSKNKNQQMNVGRNNEGDITQKMG